MKLLLDTCTFLWMAGGVEQLSAPALAALENGDNSLHLSLASAWEIQIKHQRGSLHLTDTPAQIVAEGLSLHGVHFETLANDAIWHLGKLPTYHKDPFDRILIATALRQGMQMVTPDPDIAKYPVPVIW